MEASYILSIKLTTLGFMLMQSSGHYKETMLDKRSTLHAKMLECP